MIYEYMNLPVKTFRVVNAWTKQALLETRSFEEAEAFREEEMQRNEHDEIELIAVLLA